MAISRRAGSIIQDQNTGQPPGALSITVPASAVVGDIGIISLFVLDGTYKSATTSPTGWTKLELDGTTTNLVIFWKVLATGDPGRAISINGMGGPYRVICSMEVWAGARNPAATFARAAGVWPSAPSPAGSVPLYIGYAYDDQLGTAAPATISPPAGLSGTYGITTLSPRQGLGVWYGPPTTGTTAPSVTFGFTASFALLATVVLSPDGNCILAGATATQDQVMQLVLAGSQAGLDTVLVWAP